MLTKAAIGKLTTVLRLKSSKLFLWVSLDSTSGSWKHSKFKWLTNNLLHLDLFQISV